MPFPEFRSQLEHRLVEFGPVRRVTSLRGGSRVGSFILEGEEKSVQILIPAEMEDGEWRPCPQSDPFGEVRPPP
jgi:hypothetical protein